MTERVEPERANGGDASPLHDRISELEAEVSALKTQLAQRSAAHRQDAAEQQRLELRIHELGNALRDRHERFLDMLENLQDREEDAVGLLAREREARAEAAAAGRYALLAEASSVLASSLDYDEMLESVARLSVPRMADWCVTYRVDDDGAIHPVGVAHIEPAETDTIHRLLERYPPRPDWESNPVVRVIQSGESQWFSEMSDARLAALTKTAEHRHLLEQAGARSMMIVPMLARGRTLGAIAFALGRTDRRFDEEDLALARELARRAAFAIDNAQLFERAQTASQAKSDFLAVMSHELRTPLNAILGYTDLLEAEVTGALSDQQKDQLGRISISARHLLELIEEILTFSRIEAGKEQLSIGSLELSPFTREVATLVRPLAEEKGLDFDIVVPDETVRMKSDPGKVRQILLNLLSNAVKFTEEGRVELSVRMENGSAIFRVADTGVGIEPEALAEIFKPFWQVEQQTTRRRGGTGLGLSVTQRLARMLGGDVHAESTPGEGSVFTVELPLRISSAAEEEG